MKKVSEIIDLCTELYEDIDFTASKKWKDAEKGRKVIGYMPVYVPREIIHAGNMLPLGILGGGDNMEVIHGDAYYQSYICRIPRSTIELAITKRLDFVDGMLFPSICDVIRNLSGMWKMMFPQVYVRYFDVPQNYKSEIGGNYYAHELHELKEGLEGVAGRKITDEDIRRSIAVYNENRKLVNEVYNLRTREPWKTPSSEVYLLMRAGMVLPVEEHSQLIQDYLAAAEAEDRPMRDNCRIILQGSFCEQPPLNLVKSIELSGCYIVNDDYMLVSRWLLEDVSTDGDPIANLAESFIKHSAESAAKYEPDGSRKGQFLIDDVKNRAAEGVIFAAPSFCDPALLDRPMLAHALTRENIPYISFKYAENSGQMQPIREQAGTFADTIKLWSEA
ncbi:MAG: benzoyl-CoA reductase subunit C [Rhodospirillales bacterium]|nr:benzoyl-CoA reductase subunit C [Rhodospirillales bacterium]